MNAPPWTVRLKASDEQKERIRAAAQRDGKEIGEWVLQATDAAALASVEWRQVYFGVLVYGENWHDILGRFQQMEGRFGAGIVGLGGIVRFASKQTTRGLEVSYRTATQLPDTIEVVKLVGFHVGDLGVGVETWGEA